MTEQTIAPRDPRKVMTLAGSLKHDGAPVSLDDMDRAIADGATDEA